MRSLFAAVLLSTLAAPACAGAHAILVDSTPAPLSHRPAGPLALVFRYNSRIDAARSKLVLLRPGATAQRLTTETAAPPDLLKATLDLTPGDYTLTWQVLATDGHITRGRVPFTVDPAPAARASRS